MQFTGMDQDTVERNTCRDFFMTPEDAIQQGRLLSSSVVVVYGMHSAR
jgi:ATP-dependent protease ClpP protease subunit